MNFLKLHRFDSEEEMTWINMDLVSEIREFSDDHSVIIFNGEESTRVMESPDQIMDMLEF
jgi:hypothetical protein